MRPAIAAIAFVALFCLGGEARSADVDLEVILAADVSRSVDDAEFDLQRKGYAAALTDPRVLAAIHGRSGAAIGVCFIEWSGDEDQQVVVDWTEIRDEEDAGSMAAAILAAPRSYMGRTSSSAAIDFAMAHFATSKWQAKRRIIDISGDGTNNSGRPVTEARDQAVSQGVTINGLAIINDVTPCTLAHRPTAITIGSPPMMVPVATARSTAPTRCSKAAADGRRSTSHIGGRSRPMKRMR